MMDEREELMALRRMAELEAKAGTATQRDIPKEELFPAKLGRQVLDIGAGAVRGAGSIGATIMAPVDAAARALGVQNDYIGRTDRREAMDAGLRDLLGADTDSVAYKTGKLGAEVAGTLGVGGAAGNLAARIPGVAAAAPELLSAIRTAGMTGGGMPTRMAGAGVNGLMSAGLVNPSDAASGAAVGAITPPVIAGAGKVGNLLGRVVSGPEVPQNVKNALVSAQDSGYVVPPAQVRPSLINRFLEGTAGKISVAQNASAKNQEVTNQLVRSELGLPEGQITTEALDRVRSEAGKAYEAVASLGRLPVQGKGVAGIKATVDTAGESTSRFIDARQAVEAWKQANHDATGYFRAYARDANPETLAKAKAAAGQAKEIDAFLMKSAPSELGDALKAARTLIAKTHDAEAALNVSSGNIDAKKFAQMLQKDKPLSGGLRKAGEFAGQFPKAAQMPEKMGSLPQFSPLDLYATLGAGAAGMYANDPKWAALALLRPAARAAALSPVVQNRLGAQPINLLGAPGLQQMAMRTSPLLAADR